MATQRQCELALERFEDDLSARRNVVGLGIVAEDEEGNSRGRALGVYVLKKVPLEKLSAKDRLPKTVTVSKAGTDVVVPVRVIESGAIVAEPVDSLRG